MTQDIPPALLDLHYAQGVIPSDVPLRHEDLVSLIMPSYNNEAWITRAIHSALSQQGVRIELIVVDDGSTDGSVAVARRIAAEVPNMRVISLLRNFGCYYARNIAVLQARGAYVGLIDSDDILAPDRILRQLDALKAVPGALACRCRLRRWTPDFLTPLNDLKHVENGLLWRRDVTERIGYYDSVRFGGDSEFGFRLETACGAGAIVMIPDELYFLRSVDGSLTSPSGGSPTYRIDKGRIKPALSGDRWTYYDNFAAWQALHTPASATAPCTMRMEFPQLTRPFGLGSEAQNASPSLGQRRVGVMATSPANRDRLEASLVSILPQLDRLILCPGEDAPLPGAVQDSRIRIIPPAAGGPGAVQDRRLFRDLPQDDATYVLTFDDSLVYPPDHVAQMIHRIEMLGRAAVVGLQGAVPGAGADPAGRFVDLLGTGTLAWHSSVLKPGAGDLAAPGPAEAWFAAVAARQGVPLFCIQRAAGWLPELPSRLPSGADPDGAQAPLRRMAEAALTRGFDPDTLAAAGFRLAAGQGAPVTRAMVLRRPFVQHSTPPAEDIPPAPLRFHIVATGRNCRRQVDATLRAIALQRPGPYAVAVTLVDDASDDGTCEKLAAAAILPQARLIRFDSAVGMVAARQAAIAGIADPGTIVALVDLARGADPQMLWDAAECYLRDPFTLRTGPAAEERDADGRRRILAYSDAPDDALLAAPGGSTFRRRSLA